MESDLAYSEEPAHVEKSTRRPIDPRWMKGLSVAFGAVFLVMMGFVVVRGQTGYINSVDQLRANGVASDAIIKDLRATLAAATEASVCRDRFRFAILDAQVDNQIAFNGVLREAVTQGDVNAALTALDVENTKLTQARNDQQAYQKNPTLPCPI